MSSNCWKVFSGHATDFPEIRRWGVCNAIATAIAQSITPSPTPLGTAPSPPRPRLGKAGEIMGLSTLGGLLERWGWTISPGEGRGQVRLGCGSHPSH